MRKRLREEDRNTVSQGNWTWRESGLNKNQKSELRITGIVIAE